MDDGFTRYSNRDKVTIQAHPRAITPGSKIVPQERETPPADTAILGRYANDRLNSRAVVPLGNSRIFRPSWRHEMGLDSPPVGIAQSGGRILVFSVSKWALFDLSGKKVGEGVIKLGEVRLDAGRQMFYAPDFSGLVAAYRLSDGALAFDAFFNSGQNYFRSFVARRERLLVLLSSELQIDMGKPEPQNTILEVSDLGDPANQKTFGEKGEPIVVADLVRNTQLAYVALHGNVIVYATENRIYGLDMKLAVHQILTGTFVPVAISLDGLGRIYLLAMEGGRTVLSCITVGGERLFAFALPPGVTSNHAPIVGYDHTSYIVTESRIYAVSPLGNERWSGVTAGRCAGAMVTPDDRLIAAEGSVIAVYDGTGERHELARLPESIAVAPVLFAPGRILAASGTALYLLEAET
jgi:hypothetical protein